VGDDKDDQRDGATPAPSYQPGKVLPGAQEEVERGFSIPRLTPPAKKDER
jgi:hypothetical protein